MKKFINSPGIVSLKRLAILNYISINSRSQNNLIDYVIDTTRLRLPLENGSWNILKLEDSILGFHNHPQFQNEQDCLCKIGVVIGTKISIEEQFFPNLNILFGFKYYRGLIGHKIVYVSGQGIVDPRSQNINAFFITDLNNIRI